MLDFRLRRPRQVRKQFVDESDVGLFVLHHPLRRRQRRSRPSGQLSKVGLAYCPFPVRVIHKIMPVFAIFLGAHHYRHSITPGLVQRREDKITQRVVGTLLGLSSALLVSLDLGEQFVQRFLCRRLPVLEAFLDAWARSAIAIRNGSSACSSAAFSMLLIRLMTFVSSPPSSA